MGLTTVKITFAMYHQIKLSHFDETKKQRNSQIVRAKENFKLSHGGPKPGCALALVGVSNGTVLSPKTNLFAVATLEILRWNT